MQRGFEQISQKQWDDDFNNILEMHQVDYPKHQLPKRGSKNSAGYDFFSPINEIIPAHGTAKIPTGVKVYMQPDEVLMIYPRSSIGFKTNIRLSNTAGVIDSDYYNNLDNEGHIWIKFYNPTDEDYRIFIGDKIAQGIFTKFLVTDDDNTDQNRTGGLGSTGK
jgi:dUTP pyrophosphatase